MGRFWVIGFWVLGGWFSCFFGGWLFGVCGFLGGLILGG